MPPDPAQAPAIDPGGGQTLKGRPWRRSLRVSLRSLIVLILVISGWLGWIVHRARVQRDAVAAMGRAGAYVAYDWEMKNGNFLVDPEPPGPRWLVDHIGVDFFSNVIFISLDGPRISAAELTEIGDPDRLEDLRFAKLEGPRTSAAELTEIGHLDRLEVLQFAGQGTSDAGFGHLRRLTRLKTLQLWDTEITDAGLAHLEGLTGLVDLTLASDRVTDAGLDHLKELTELRELWLSGKGITDAGMIPLRRLTGLQSLSLWKTRVTVAGVRHLQEALPNLKILHGALESPTPENVLLR